MDSAALMELWDAVEQVEALPNNVVWLRRAHAALVNAGTIERYMRPSPRPGVAQEDGGKPGANPLQINFWKTFDEHVYGGGDATTGKLIFACVAANRAGKTIATFGKFCQHLRDKAKHGDVYWLIAASIDSMKGVPLRTIWNMLPKSMFGNRWHYNPQGNLPTTIILDLPGGRGTVELWPKTENQDIQEFESEAVSGWLWTECRREAILHALEPRMSSGGFGIMDYIPCEGWHATFRNKSINPKSKVHYVEATVFDNQHNLAPGFVVNEMPTQLGGRGTMSVSEWQTRGLGRPAAFEGIVYKQFNNHIGLDKFMGHGHVVPAFPIPPEWPLFVWGDWGYRNFHSLCCATVAPNEAKYVAGEEYDNECTVFEVCKRMWNLVSSIRAMSCGQWGDPENMFMHLKMEMNVVRMRGDESWGSVSTPVRDHIRSQWERTIVGGWVMDASIFDRDQEDGSSLADHFEGYGVPVTASIKANKDGGVELVRRHFEQLRLFFFENCYRTREDHSTWKYKENKDREPDPDDKYERKNDHACAMVMYGLRSGPVHNPAQGVIVSTAAP